MYQTIDKAAAIPELRGIASAYYHEDGTLSECILSEKNIIPTLYGDMIPRYGPEEVRKKYNHSISFYPGGALKSMALEEQTEINTSLGTFPAELVTFYESGSVKRIFPLNGKITGYWTEADEGQLCREYRFSFPFGSFKAKIISLCFYENGNLKALTLWPGETIILKNKADLYPVRIGFSLYEDGSLKSLEPAYDITLATPIGNLCAFDADALGMNAENNSLCFKKNGSIHSLKTSVSRIEVHNKNGNSVIMAPGVKPDPLEDDRSVILPLKITFEGSNAKFEGENPGVYPLSTTGFSVINDDTAKDNRTFACGDCSSCSLCGR